jgi:starch synthase
MAIWAHTLAGHEFQTPNGMSATIYYHPEAYTTNGPRLMGRNAAGESFLRGFLKHCSADEIWTQVQTPEHAKEFARIAQSMGRVEPIRAIDKNSLGYLSEVGMVYYPSPDLCEHAFQRSFYGHNAWSLCGITHTTSSARTMDALASLISAPVQPWDALICTSTAVKNNVERLLQAQIDYLKDRLGITKMVLPQLPVIPLGVHSEDFIYSESQKADARSILGVTADTLVVLYMGRLSFHAKAHPLAMYQALESAAKSSGKKVLLVECGWHANDFIQEAYLNAALLACPSVRVLTLDGRKAENRQTAWAGADLFCSLSDNIQESFGITPIEAMAAGIPVVVSDWDGYKESVREGVDGFRIPTLMPQEGLGSDLALRHALEIDSYDLYCGHTCSLVAVDVQATTSAFERLFNSSDLRNRMGQAGRKRAQEVYDWKHIIGKYETLWKQLNELRNSQGKEIKHLAHPWPSRMDPFSAFVAYPTATLTPLTKLALVDTDVEASIMRALAFKKLAMVDFAKDVLPSDEEIRKILNTASQSSMSSSMKKSAIDLVASVEAVRKPFVLRSLAWLLKLGVLKVVT